MSEKRIARNQLQSSAGSNRKTPRRAMAAHNTIPSVVVLEKRILLAVSALTILAFILWIVSVSTNYWFTVHVPGGAYLNNSKTYFLKSNSGLWRICRTEFRNHSSGKAEEISECHYHELFPSDKEVRRNPEIDQIILRCGRHMPRSHNQPCLDYTRTETAFSIISILLMIMGHGFSVYTFYEPRYMFKRLAGGVHFLTAATILVLVEVLINSVNYEKNYLPERHPKDANWSYGFSFYLACFCFALYIVAGCAFIVCSRKRKGDRAPSEMHALADEPHILGRV